MSKEVLSSRPGLTVHELLISGRKVLSGRAPLLSIEITRECPLTCPGCYAYGAEHLGGGINLRQLSDFRGDALVEGVLGLVRQHRPLHVSLVGGEPLVRHRELSRILPELNAMRVFTLVVTSAVIPIPMAWMDFPRVRVAVSIDGLPEHHDVRRKPATYAKILKNIEGRSVNIHWTVTRPMLSRPGYVEDYVSFWSARPEVNRIWVSLYSPQVGENSAEILTSEQRAAVAGDLLPLRTAYPKLLMNEAIAQAFINPPQSPHDCLFSKMSVNYSADLTTRVEPCIFGGTPDCSQCGCAISSGLHGVRKLSVAGPLKIGHLVRGAMGIGSLIRTFSKPEAKPTRWQPTEQPAASLVAIAGPEREGGGDTPRAK